MRRRILGDENRETLTSASNLRLAVSLSNQGNLKHAQPEAAAERIYREVLGGELALRRGGYSARGIWTR